MQKDKVVLLVVIAIIGIFLLSTLSSHQQHVAPLNSSGPTFSTITTGPSAQPTAVKSPPISWKLYHSDQYGYEMSYPQSWQLTEAQPQPPSPTSHWAGDYLQPGELQKVTFSTTLKKDDADYGFHFEVNVSSTTLTNLNQLDIIGTGGSSMVEKRQYFKLSGIDAVRLSVFEFDRTGAIIYAFNHGHLYELHFDENNPSDPWFDFHRQIYSTMANSFRFL
jgi:hypothetical protein